jgi:hypothetical protein
VEAWRQLSTKALWAVGWLFAAMANGATVGTAETPTALDARWREPLGRAEAALAEGQARQAEQAWEEAQRAAMRATSPPTGLVDVGRAYLRIGEAAHDRQTAVARARVLYLRALFRARERGDVAGMTAAGEAFANLGDCEVARRAFAVVRTVAPQRSEPPTVCERLEVRQPSASPRSHDLRSP